MVKIYVLYNIVKNPNRFEVECYLFAAIDFNEKLAYYRNNFFCDKARYFAHYAALGFPPPLNCHNLNGYQLLFSAGALLRHQKIFKHPVQRVNCRYANVLLC